MIRLFMSVLMIMSISAAKPVTFKAYGVIWVCSDDYFIWAERNAASVNLSNEKLHIDQTLQYDEKNENYVSKDGKFVMHYEGNSLNDPNVSFKINGKKHKCYFEYIENENN